MYKNKNFNRFALLTVISVYFLIFVGGLVRASGSGMGCPDWPRCFQRWVPPTSIDQLPKNYKEIYGVNGILVEDFNPIKTWTEYLNRLLGVLIGIFVLLTALYSVRYLKTDKQVTVISFVALILVVFQAWLGAKVVFSNLNPIKITVHMAMAIVIVMLLLYVYFRTLKTDFPVHNSKLIVYLVSIVCFITFIQVILGTQVRQVIDNLSHSGVLRTMWADKLPSLFYVHRSFSIVILGINLWMMFTLKRYISLNRFTTLMLVLMSLVLFLEILAGISLYYLQFPAWCQPLHLLMGCVLFGLQFILLLYVLKSYEVKSNQYA